MFKGWALSDFLRYHVTLYTGSLGRFVAPFLIPPPRSHLANHFEHLGLQFLRRDKELRVRGFRVAPRVRWLCGSR